MARLARLEADYARLAPGIPLPAAVPRPVDGQLAVAGVAEGIGEPGAAAAPALRLDRRALQVCLAVDGRRTVAELAAGYGMARTARLLRTLVESGVLELTVPSQWEEPPAAVDALTEGKNVEVSSTGSRWLFHTIGQYAGHALIFAALALFASLIRSAAGPADRLLGFRAPAPQERLTAPAQLPSSALLIAKPRAALIPATPAADATATAAPAVAPTAEPTSIPAPVAAGAGQPPLADGAALPPASRLVIPRIRLDTKVVDVGILPSGEMDTAAYAAGRLSTSAQPGEAGNVVIAGHDDILGEVFRRLPEVQVGDQFALYRGAQAFTYRVEVRTIVREDGAPEAQRRDNAKWMEPTDDPVVTLISCYPYRVDTHRIIVRARLLA